MGSITRELALREMQDRDTWDRWRREPDNDNGTAAWPRVVAFTGVAGSGKSTAADALVRRGYTRVKFAGPLKDMCRAIGLTDRHIEGDLKEQPCEMLCGKSPRQFMQALGTQFGRDLIGPNLWVGLWAERVRQCLARGDRVVTDDCRFPNEAAAVRAWGGRVVRLVGRGGIAGQHVSEAQVFEVDATVVNDGSLADLVGKVLAGVRRAA